MLRRKRKNLVKKLDNYSEQDNIFLRDFKVCKDDILQHEKFIRLYRILKIKFFDYGKYFSSKEINDNIIFFHLGDEPYNIDKLLKINNNFDIIYTVNCEIKDDRIISIPLGITDTSHCSLIGDLDIIEEFNKTERNYKNLAYINFNTDRNDQGLPDRLLIKKIFSQEDWVTDGKFQRNKEGHRKFIDNIYNHKFVFCPRGNGVDTHRLWMSLYLGTIPIVKDHIVHSKFKHLPILFINDWSEINKEFLENKFEEIHSKKYDMNILRMSYWENYIKENME